VESVLIRILHRYCVVIAHRYCIIIPKVGFDGSFIVEVRWAATILSN